MSRKKFLILFIVLVGLGSIIKIAESGTLSDSGMGLTNLYNSSVAWGDIDNDGDFDLAMMGWDGTNKYFQIYENGANNGLSLSPQSLTALSHGCVSFGDYDRDGDLDLAITGKDIEGNGTTKIYQNNGNGNFSDTGIEMIDVYDSALAWGDYDNDGDLDLAVIGSGMMGIGKIAKIYENYEKEGVITFKDSEIIDLTPVASGYVAWADYDNDGWLDIAICGDSIGGYVSEIWKNDGDGSFTKTDDLTGVYNSSLAWGDYNNDGWLDIAICGDTIGECVSEIWKNDGGTFSGPQSLDGVYNSSLAWGDYDNDGDLDLVVTGLTSGPEPGPSSKIYRNKGDGTFEDSGILDLTPVDLGSVAWCDYDGDKDIDLALTGDSGSGAVTKIYMSDGFPENNLPKPPESSSLKAEYNSADGELTISWSSGSDTETDPATGLYYNFRIGSEPGKDDLVAARYGSPLLGNFISKSTTTVHTRTFTLYAKGYYWSVQVIDTGLGCSWSQEGEGSGWSGEDQYHDDTPPPAPETPTDEGEYTYNTTIRFSWTQNNSDPQTAIYNYRLQVESQEDGKIKFDGSVGDVKSYNVSGCEYNKTYKARVKAQSGGGYGDWSADWSNGIMVVRLLDISYNLIHPRKGEEATIKYFIISSAKVNLKIYNLMGELVRSLVDNQYKAVDDYVETWSGENEKGSTVASGIYLVHIEVEGESATEKICVVK
ncbi:hypothetical protein ES705_02224 [subsurface metagenome]|nr:T9SS type A sorting domain-containing protein [Clostridia bacterium]